MSGFCGELNSEQQLCVKALDGPVLVLAGAGSGKTRVLTHRIACLISERNIKPYNILAITFTNKAAGEMKERLEKMLGDTGGMWICTIHGMCNRILRQFIDRTGYTKTFSIYSDDDKERVIKRIIADTLSKDQTDDGLIKEVKYHISNAKNQDMTPEQYSESGYDSKNFATVCRLYSLYEKELKKNNALDFDDLIIKTYRLLKEDSEVQNYIQDKFQYIHIDEFQDTNTVQYKLVSLMAYKHKNLFAVGDDDQSIYGWRGAEVENINRFRKDFENTKLFKLQRNYRSTKKILSIANSIIKNNTMRISKELWTENSDGVRAEKFEASDENNEAYYVSSMIKSLVNHNNYKYGDFAVLIRMNALTRAFEQEFLKYGLPYRIYGGFKFFERKEIKDIIAYLRLIINPFDDESVIRVINFPKRGIGDSTINVLRSEAAARGLTIYDIILDIDNTSLSASVKNKITAFKDIVLKIMQAYELYDMPKFIRELINVTGIYAVYAEDTEENINRRLNIDEFVNSFIKHFEDNPQSELEEYLTSITLVSDIDEADDSGITLATIHSVKGLEFKTVFICGLDDGIFPLKRAYNSPQELEEERRLMYVAVTRAEERLFFTRAKSRFIYGQRNYTLPSEFLGEIAHYFDSPKKMQYQINDGITNSSYSGYFNDNKYISGVKKAETKENISGDTSAFKEGSKVYHQKFGEGIIVSLSGKGNTAMADIAFPKLGVKTFTLKFAPIKLL